MSKLILIQIVWCVVQDIIDGVYVNFGIGFFEMVVQFQFFGCQVIFYIENGIFGFGEVLVFGIEDWDLINVGKKVVMIKLGMVFFYYVDSFVMVCGGYLDVVILGVYQVVQNGDLVNWFIGFKGVFVVGGVMDLVYGVKCVVVIIDYVIKDGKFKLLEVCILLLIGVGCVMCVYILFVVVDIQDGYFVLCEKLFSLFLDEL